MYISKTHYLEAAAEDNIVSALSDTLDKIEAEPIFICIGSAHHLLDCLGPLTGTMLKDKARDIKVFGTLEYPLHAKNLVKEMREIKRLHMGKIEIAIDASVGDEEEIGLIQLRQGGVIARPGLWEKLAVGGAFLYNRSGRCKT
jgi:putative sporulation protein YyaC